MPSTDSDDGLRLMVYDQTCRGAALRPGLTHAWWLGAQLYRTLGRLDATKGVRSWGEALEWLAEFRPDRPIAEVQYWGHGKWGRARVDEEPLELDSLATKHELHAPLKRVAKRMLPEERGLWWFRTCETFGALPGHRFAQAFSDFMGCRAAGHTYIIGHIQSGLHSIAPGAEPDWPIDEALREGSPESPKRAYWSGFRAPNTITCLRGDIPAGY